MFSKKKKGDGKADAAAAPAAPAAEAPAEAAAPPEAPAEGDAGEAPKSGGLLAGGLGAKAKSPGIAASRLGGRPPSRQSAPAPEPVAPPPAPPPAPPAPPVQQSLPERPVTGLGTHGLGTSSGQNAHLQGSNAEFEMSQSGKNMAMQANQAGMPQPVEAAGDGKKNPYKLNPLFDIILPVSMAVILCGGFAYTTKIVKDKHDIYGYTQDEQSTFVKIKELTMPAVLDEIKKMEMVKLLDSGDKAGALALAKTVGAKAYALAKDKGMVSAKSEPPQDAKALEEEGLTVRELLASGIVMCEAGAKADKDLGIVYAAKGEEIATYSKYARLIYARQLAKLHRPDEAIEQYQKITTLFKEPWPLPHKELGLLYMRNNKGPEAVAELTEVTKEDPADPSIQRQLGLAMAQGGDQQAGFEEFQKGFTKEGDVLSYPAAVKGLVDAHGGLVDATLQDVKKQAEKNPDDIKLQLDLARLDIATGKIKDARDLMEKARKTQELNPEVHEVLSEVMVRQNQAQSGFDEFRSAVQNLHLQ